jgi:hypothetical protein
MPSATNRHIPLDEKLIALQQSDCLRQWQTLDDRRICIVCNRVITGRMVDIWQSDDGTYNFHCPTPGCPSTLRDWFYHGPVRSAGTRGPRRFAPMSSFGASWPNE